MFKSRPDFPSGALDGGPSRGHGVSKRIGNAVRRGFVMFTNFPTLLREMTMRTLKCFGVLSSCTILAVFIAVCQ